VSPTAAILKGLQPGYLAPPFEQAKVHDVMRAGVVSCPPDTSLREVARMMATHHIHCVVVSNSDASGERPWGVVSDLDLARAAGPEAARRTAGEVASTELVTVAADDSIEHAAQLMAEHEVSHLLVVQPQTGHPLGVLSTLNLARVLAWDDSS